jgi:hypothetical protein
MKLKLTYLFLFCSCAILSNALISCRLISINGFSNLQKTKHIVNKEYEKDTLYLRTIVYYPRKSNHTIRNPKTGYRGVESRDSISNLDSLPIMIENAFIYTNLLIDKHNLIVKEDEQLSEVKNIFRYAAFPDKYFVELGESIEKKTSIVIFLIHDFGLFRNDSGTQQNVLLFLKLCIVKGEDILYSKYFLKEKASEEFSRSEMKDYSSVRDFFDANGHSQYFDQEDWNSIIEFAMKEYTQRLKN